MKNRISWKTGNKILVNICLKYIWVFLSDDSGGHAEEVKSQESTENLGYRVLGYFSYG